MDDDAGFDDNDFDDEEHGWHYHLFDAGGMVEGIPMDPARKLFYDLPSLKLTAKAPENGWLEYYRFLWDGLFSGAMLTLGRVISWFIVSYVNASLLVIMADISCSMVCIIGKEGLVPCPQQWMPLTWYISGMN